MLVKAFEFEKNKHIFTFLLKNLAVFKKNKFQKYLFGNKVNYRFFSKILGD